MTDVLVTGGTGHLGRELVPRLITAGYDVRVLSRQQQPPVPVRARTVRGDLTTGEGIADAVAGADIIVHCASGTGTVRGLMYRSARRTDVDATARMLELIKEQGLSPHVVYISIVGIDKVPLGYYRAKLETERVIETSGFPHTILRTTQWHTLADEFCRRLTAFPIVVVPKGVRLQLLDPGEVADRMASLVSSPAAGRTDDMGGPAPLDFEDVVRAHLEATGKRRTVRSMRFPGKTIRAFADGHNLTPDHADGRVTWSDWLAASVASI